MDEPLLVRFWMDAYPNAAKTLEHGHPCFDTVAWCEIKVPGERDTITGPVHKMDRDPRQRFPEAWAKFQKDNGSEGLVGTPLKFLPWMERGDVETLAYVSVRTLEQLASVSDANLSNIPGGVELRKKAREYIKAAKDDAPMQRLAEEVAKKDSEIAELRAQISEILAAKQQKKGRDDR